MLVRMPGRGEWEEPLYSVGGNVQPLWKVVWKFLKKLKIELLYDPVILLLGLHLKDYKLGYNRDTCTPMFIALLFTITRLWKQPRCPTTD
jgi:hypothetical protein